MQRRFFVLQDPRRQILHILLGFAGWLLFHGYSLASHAGANQAPRACIALEDRERQFFAGVALLGREQITLGKLALTHATRADVRRLAQQTINAYIRMGAQLNTLAEAKGVILPTSLDADQRAKHERLAATQGANFDALYLKMQSQAHTDLTTLFITQAQNQGDRQLTTWAQNALPQLEAHGRRVAAAKRATPAAQTAEDAPN